MRLAGDDHITKLPNRVRLMGKLRKGIDRARNNGSVLALLFLDLEEFRNFKYTFGHVFSDALLFEVGARLTRILRPGDYLARLGHGEFAFVMHEALEWGEVRAMAETISSSLGAPFELAAAGRHWVKASIGITLYPRDARHDRAYPRGGR